MSNSETLSGNDAVVLSPEETDILLARVNQQLAANGFDSSNLTLIKQMVECLGDTRGMVRLGFAEALGQVGKPAVPFLLTALANHPNPVVRRAAAKTLTLIADPEAVPILIKALLEDEDTVVKGSAIGALAGTGAASVPPLLEILASPDSPESTKGHAAWALAFIGPAAKEILYREIHSDSPEVRMAVVGAIAKMAEEQPDSEASEMLFQALEDVDSEVRCEAIAALGNISYAPAIPRLMELLQHQDGESRKGVAMALMKMGDEVKDQGAMELLNTALIQETDPTVQRAMQLAISHLRRD